jgi:FKBP-type peptidyl-prolyl cis-trans isomerase FklB
MKSTSVSAIILLALGVVACNQGGTGSSGTADTPETLEERASYALGFSAGQQLSSQASDLDVDQLVAGIRDAFAGSEGQMTAEEIQSAMTEYQQAMMAAEDERRNAEATENKAAGDAFLADNADKPGIMVTDSGLQYEVLEEGTGASPLATDQVTVHYEGRLIDGTVFDSSIEKGEPVTFPLNRVIPGWSEGVQLMKVGAKYRFYIPGELGYGMTPPPGDIGPNATLVFDVELLAINGQS